MSTQALVSIEQFEQMLRESDVDSEFDNGEIVPLPSPVPIHSVIQGAIFASLHRYLESKLRGGVLLEIDFRLSEQQVRRPDIAVLSSDKCSAMDIDTAPVNGIPDLVVVVSSPIDKLHELEHKLKQY